MEERRFRKPIVNIDFKENRVCGITGLHLMEISFISHIAFYSCNFLHKFNGKDKGTSG